jgi:hypothetical protein
MRNRRRGSIKRKGRGNKMKESKPPSQKTSIRVVSQEPMAPDQQAHFDKAIDALLAELIRFVDRRNNKGDCYGNTEK